MITLRKNFNENKKFLEYRFGIVSIFGKSDTSIGKALYAKYGSELH